MKTNFLKAFAAVVMLFSFSSFVHAEGELVITAVIENAGEGVTLTEGTNAYSATDVVLGENTKLTLTCAGADIYYTTDGTTPVKSEEAPAAKDGDASANTTVKYDNPFVLTSAMVNNNQIVIKAIAYKEAAEETKATETESDVVTITLTLKEESGNEGPDEPETPVKVDTAEFKFIEGANGSADTLVVVYEATKHDSILVATSKDFATDTTFVTFKKNDTIVLTQDTMVLAYAMKDGKYSDTAKYVYTKPAVNPDPATVDAPEFKFIEGAEGSADTLVVVYVAAKHDSILVAMNKDFATATDTTFVTFKKNDTIVMTQDTMVVLAYAMKDGESSKTVKSEYKKTTTPVDPDKVNAPEIKKLNDTTVVVLKGEADSIFVAMGVDSAAALTNGFAKFTVNDTIKLAADTVILAYAMKGEESSDTVKYEFKKAVSSANETKELAGVSVYPNPSNGEFNVSVAENVTVEVFNTNGQIVKRARLNAGVNAMQLNYSGIYFVRFTAANGQVAIKKVVVR